MAFSDEKLVIKIEADIKDFDKAAKDIERAEKEIADKGKQIADKMSGAGQALNEASSSASEFSKTTAEAADSMGEVSAEISSISSATGEVSASANEAAGSLGEIASVSSEASAELQSLSSATDEVASAESSLQSSNDSVAGSLKDTESSSGSLDGAYKTLSSAAQELIKVIKEMTDVLKDNKGQTEENVKATGDLVKAANQSVKLQKFSDFYLKAAKAVVQFGKEVYKTCKELVDAYAVQEQAETRLEAINKSMGESVGLTTAELKDMASALQNNSTFGDEIIMGAQKTLLALGTLNRDGFEKALQASADLAAAMGTDIDSAAQSLSQALLDPENGLRRLRTAGVAFTDAEKEQIKVLTEAGRTQEAQMLILEKVESKYKGVAKAIADTDTGKLKQISNTWGDIKENLGKSVLDSVSPFLDSVLEKLNKIQDKTKTSNNISSLIKGKAEFDDYSTEDLEKALELAEKRAAAQRRIADEHGAAGLGSSQYDKIIEDLKEELKLRREIAETAEREKKADEERQKQEAEYNAFLARKEEAKSKANALIDANLREDEGTRLENLILSSKAAQKALGELGLDYEVVLENGRYVKKHTAEWEKLNLLIKQSEKNLENYNQSLEGLSEFEKIVSEYGSLSPTSQADEIDKEIERIKTAMEGLDATSVKVLNEIISGLEKQKSALLEVEDPIESIINEFGSLSKSLNASKIQAEISKIRGAIKDVSEKLSDAEEKKDKDEIDRLKKILQYLTEILSTKKEDLKVTTEGSSESDPEDEKTNPISDFLNKGIEGAEMTYGQVFNSIASAYGNMLSTMSAMRSQFLQNEIDSLQAELDARLEANDITQEEEKKMMEAISNAKAKQFESEKRNSIAQAIINGALGITSIWSTQGKVPWLASALSAMLTATTAAQVATIASQSYQGFERGGIVAGSGITGDKHPILANAGELILTRAQQASIAGQLTQSSAPIISVNFSGNVFGDEKSISEYVYNGIRNAQREGALAQW